MHPIAEVATAAEIATSRILRTWRTFERSTLIAEDMMPRLNDAEIEQGLASLTGWKRDAHLITKQYTFPSFPDALAFLVRLGFDCEAADHHPDITVDYKRVTLGYWTHSEGGITEKDLAGASTADRVAASFIR